MSYKNLTILTGNLGKDVELKRLDSGKAVAKFSLATSETYTNKQGEKVTDTQWHDIVAWGKSAEFAERQLKKGSSVTIFGKLTYRTHEHEGQKRYYTEIVANEIIPHVWAKGDQGPGEDDEPDWLK